MSAKSRRNPTPAQSPSPASSGRWLGIGAVVVGAALGVVSVRLWRQHQFAVRIQGSLPAEPAPAGRPQKFAELVGQAERLATSGGHQLEGVTELARLYHANGLAKEAEACWLVLQREQPAEARWIYYLADLRRTESDYSGMESLLKKTIELAPGYAPARLRLADLEFKTGETEEAQKNYAERLSQVPRDPYARLGLVRVALQAGKRSEARELLVALTKDSPQFSPGHNLYAEMLDADGQSGDASRQRWLGRETGRFREADDPWLEELNAWCYDSKRLCVLGTVDYQTEHGDRGETYFKRAIECQPDDLAAYEQLGTLYVKLNEPAKARETLEAGLKRPHASKPTPMYYVNLSHAFRMLKQPADAVQAARDGLHATSEAFELYDALGVALGESGDYPAGVAALEQALALNGNDANVNYNLALCLLAVGREDEAVAALKRSLVLQPTFPNSLLLLGRRELDAGRWQEAETYLRPLYESHPEMPEVRQMAARWRFQAGRAAEAAKDLAGAERQYRNGLGIDGGNPDLNAALGVLFLMEGKIADAIAPLEAYHRALPDDPRSALFLGQAMAMAGRIDDARRLLAEGALTADRVGNAATAANCREILATLPAGR